MRHKTSVVSLAILFVLATVPGSNISKLKSLLIQPAIAQSAGSSSFQVPTTVPEGTTVTVVGSNSMEPINEALKQRFEKQFPGTAIKTSNEGTDAALQALRDGKVDLAAIGRPLTAAEKAEGLVAVPVSRNKIAVFVGPDSPFNQSITIEQFAKIFRGEVTDWSQVGGPKGSVHIVDRPVSSDTRQAFLNYPVFQQGSFETGATAVKLSEDKTSAVIENLGADGMGYAIADQVVGKPGVRVLPMYKTLPSDSRYPFSQPLSYVYKGPNPSPAVQAFLGYALTPESQKIVEQARGEAASNPEITVTKTEKEVVVATPIQAAPQPTLASLWWLLLPLLGLPLLLWWALGRGGPLAAAKRPSRIVLEPRNCRDAYAYWDLSEDDKKEYQAHGKKQALRLYDVTDIKLDDQQPHSVKRFECDFQKQHDMHLPIEVDNRDYLVELGYINSKDEWVKLARSEHVRVPQCSPVSMPLETPLTDRVSDSGPSMTGSLTAAGAAAAAVAAGRSMLAGDREPFAAPAHETDYSSRIILTPRNSADVYAYWEVSDEHKAALRSRGGENLKLRLCDVTHINMDFQEPHAVYEFDCAESDTDKHLPIQINDLDYLVEIGYTTVDGQWLQLARSNAVRVASAKPSTSLN